MGGVVLWWENPYFRHSYKWHHLIIYATQKSSRIFHASPFQLRLWTRRGLNGKYGIDEMKKNDVVSTNVTSFFSSVLFVPVFHSEKRNRTHFGTYALFHLQIWSRQWITFGRIVPVTCDILTVSTLIASVTLLDVSVPCFICVILDLCHLYELSRRFMPPS